MDTTTHQKNKKRRGGETPNHQPSTTQPSPLQPISIVDNPPQNWPKINRKSNQTIRKPNSKSSQTKIKPNPLENLTHNQPKPFGKPILKSIKIESNRKPIWKIQQKTHMKNPTKISWICHCCCNWIYLVAAVTGFALLLSLDLLASTIGSFALCEFWVWYMREEESSKSTKCVGLRHERGRELREY